MQANFFHSLKKNAGVGSFGRDLRLATSEVYVTSPCFYFFLISITLAEIFFFRIDYNSPNLG